MASVNYAQQYLQALQQRFTKGLSFNVLYNSPNNKNIKWVNAKTIQIPLISVGGFVDVNRDVVGNFTRRADNDWETKTLQHDREFRTLIDPQDVDESNLALTIANITRVFNDEEKIPEMDKYMASKLYSEYLEYGGDPVEVQLTEENVLSVYDDMMEQMDEAEVPQEDRILYATPAVKKILKNADKIQRTLEARGADAAINRNVRSLEEVTIVTVPSSRMKTVYNFTDGAIADSSAKQISMLLIHPDALLSPQKYDFVSLDAPSAGSGGKWLYYERKYWDVFAIEKKVPGIQICVMPDGVEED
ncbi:capsid protein [Sutcliffiella halmapala]|uniref:capsid protein n=1 Tax=Sutcliffiella halmapala TaxID=79882 RepID=UPI000995C97A|nr:capsid protein [Sutcliffiella halmapala]